MKEDLLKIFEHFGIEKQQRKLQEEVFELQDAITSFEIEKAHCCDTEDFENLEKIQEHIAEEFVDVMVLLKQFYYYYALSDFTPSKIEEQKIKRTLERIESGYYEK